MEFGEADMTRQDLATATGAMVVVAIFAIIALVAMFGVDSVPNMFDATAAAWVQAVGSVVAILAAVWTTRHEQNQRRKAARSVFVLCKANAVRGLAQGLQGCSEQVRAYVAAADATLRDAYLLAEGVQIGDLPANDALSLVRMRAELAILAVVLKEFLDVRYEALSSLAFLQLGERLNNSADRISREVSISAQS